MWKPLVIVICSWEIDFKIPFRSWISFLSLLPQLLCQGANQDSSSECTDLAQASHSSLTPPLSRSLLSAENTWWINSVHCCCWGCSLAIISFLIRKKKLEMPEFSTHLPWFFLIESIHKSLWFFSKDGEISYNIINLPVLPLYVCLVLT